MRNLTATEIQARWAEFDRHNAARFASTDRRNSMWLSKLLLRVMPNYGPILGVVEKLEIQEESK